MYEKQIEHSGIEYLFCDLREKYVNQTALLLNSEWPRSLAQRHLNLRSLLDKSTHNNEKQALKIPISLILISSKDDQVVGHASLVRIEAMFDHENKIQQSDMSKKENQAFLQSVLIHKDFRGIHLGKRLMQLCEEYFLAFAKQQELQESNESDNLSTTSLNCDYLYLNTKDKQRFYESLGYEPIEPFTYYIVKTTRCTEIMSHLFAKMSTISNNHINANKTEQTNQNDSLVPFQSSSSTKLATSFATTPTAPIPPPPPPSLCPLSVPLTTFAKDDSSTMKIDKSQSASLSWYKKEFKSKLLNQN